MKAMNQLAHSNRIIEMLSSEGVKLQKRQRRFDEGHYPVALWEM